MNVQLSADLEQWVEEKVRLGFYRSPDEVISAALQALEERDLDLETRATAFKEKIHKRLKSGPATPMDFSAVKRLIREELEARKSA